MSYYTLRNFLLLVGIFSLFSKLEGMQSAELCPPNSPCQECLSLQNSGISCHFFVVVGKTRGFFCASEDFEWTTVEGSALFSRVTGNQTCPNLRNALNVPFRFPTSTLPASGSPKDSSSPTLDNANLVNATTQIYPAQKNGTNEKILDSNFGRSESFPVALLLCVMCTFPVHGLCFLFCFRAMVRRCLRKYLCT